VPLDGDRDDRDRDQQRPDERRQRRHQELDDEVTTRVRPD
jgi:hypothetical protein